MTHLPMSRVKTIMRSSADVESVHKEAVLSLAKATEGFLKGLSNEVFRSSRPAHTITYTHVSDVVHDCEKYEFLREIIPKKITVGDYKKLLQKEKITNGKNQDPANRSIVQ
ncbi:chromatin accessibility complex protein 1 [Agrilus planipennis]|uniref:Chromatin accessibility complex protein 1 n=1 Tax=Agrilus planipennis TaxID=224129 RepID=A0A1W4X4Q4_AGRPL|nr:chromatin accessibility complex protein 1 [Agrilus planipennis]